MSIIRTALVAAALVAAAASANAQSREDLNSGYHGNTPVWQASPYAPRDEISQSARDAFGRSVAPARVQDHRGQRPAQRRQTR